MYEGKYLYIWNENINIIKRLFLDLKIRVLILYVVILKIKVNKRVN